MFEKDMENLTVISLVCSKFSKKLPSCLTHSKTNPIPLRPNRPRILPKGLASVAEGLEMLKNNRVHGEKLVYRVSDTPGLSS